MIVLCAMSMLLDCYIITVIIASDCKWDSALVKETEEAQCTVFKSSLDCLG